ncbi:hypothetical protein [Nocardia sp. NPDC051981]|uniref:hypothetical protein n=1 Tax=Nocardia sp. NPDC051981 TaxID=3155417 RepID=UPI00343D1F18
MPLFDHPQGHPVADRAIQRDLGAGPSPAGRILRRFSRWMMPVVLIVLGLYIIDRSGLVFGQLLL